MRVSSSYDYVIVGAGSAGCVLADRLTEDGRSTVLLLEAGKRDRYMWIHVPVGYAKTRKHPKYNWMFSTNPDPAMMNREIYWPRGKTLGGSSATMGPRCSASATSRGSPIDEPPRKVALARCGKQPTVKG